MSAGRRRGVALLAVAVLGAAAAGCAGRAEQAGCGAWKRGDIAFATGADPSVGGALERVVRRWEQRTGGNVRLVSLPTTADKQRSQMVATAQAKSGEYDVLGLDVVWTAEFASRGYVEPLQDRVDGGELTRAFLSQPLSTAKWDGRLWAIPLNTNVGLLFYRSDRVRRPPRSWDDLELDYDSPGGFAGQFRRNEGLTVNVLEAIWADGGDVLADGGDVVDPEGVEDALARLRRGFGPRGWIDRKALDYDQQETLTALQDGRVQFMRNWPYAYLTLKSGGSAVRDKVGVAPLPGPGAIGGQNLAIAACSQSKATALEFIEYMTGARAQRDLFEQGGYPPSRAALYRRRYGDKAVRELAPVIERAITGARSRPRRPGYTQASEIIQGVADDVIRGNLTPADAVKRLRDELGDARLD